MKITSYKQYCCGDEHTCHKLICGFRDASVYEAHAMTDHQRDQPLSRLRTMHIEFLDFDGDGKDFGEYVETPINSASFPDLDVFGQEETQYMRILLGKMPNWRLVRVGLWANALVATYYRYGKDDYPERFIEVDVGAPRHLEVQISVEGDEDHPSELYVVTMERDPEGAEHIRYDYHVNGEKQYSSVLGEDEQGSYEFITEA